VDRVIISERTLSGSGSPDMIEVAARIVGGHRAARVISKILHREVCSRHTFQSFLSFHMFFCSQNELEKRFCWQVLPPNDGRLVTQSTPTSGK
jgi:hypothetical protein